MALSQHLFDVTWCVCVSVCLLHSAKLLIKIAQIVCLLLSSSTFLLLYLECASFGLGSAETHAETDHEQDYRTDYEVH